MENKTKLINPWKAFLPYDEYSAHQFKGRTENIEDLFSRILNERITVCYADSGIGKSSLINAGLKPKFRLHMFFPIDFVFKENVLSLKYLDFDQLLIERIKDEIDVQNERSKDVQFRLEKIIEVSNVEIVDLDRKLSNTSLWWFLHTYTISCRIKGIHVGYYTPIFIFDQFEELFTNSQHECLVQSFFEWFSAIISDAFPKLVEDEVKELSNWILLSEAGFNKDFNLKILFSLRQDSMGTLDYWSSQRFSIPSLHRNRYCLLPLTMDQAKSVITEQGVDTLNGVADEIINELKENANNSVPAIMLSVFCYKLYENAKIGNDGKKENVRKEDIYTNKDTLIREYYEELLRETKIDTNTIFIIEDCLVSETGKRNRIVNGSNTRLNEIHFDEKYRKILSDKYLINDRKEFIEIAHDKVAEAIITRKKERKLKHNLRAWRFAWFLVPFALFLCSILFSLIPIKSTKRYFFQEMLVEENEYVKNNIFDKISIFEIDLPWQFKNILIDTVTNHSFYKSHLRNVKIKNNKFLGGSGITFTDCENLECIELLDSVIYIGPGFITNCPQLKTLIISSWVEEIDDGAFLVDNLSIEVDPDNKYLLWKDGVLWNKKDRYNPIVYIQKKILNDTKHIPFIETYKYKDSLKYRGEFIYALDISKARIFVNKDSTELIPSETYKFYHSIDLSKFTKVTELPDCLFKNCVNLENIILPPNLKKIGKEVFYGCERLSKIKFPRTTQSIGTNAFTGCLLLEEISFTESNHLGIDDYAFSFCRNLNKVVLPDSCSSIGYGAFSDCYNLRTVILPVRFSPRYHPLAFLRCDSLKTFEPNKTELKGGQVKDNIVFDSEGKLLWIANEKKINYNDHSCFSKNGIVYDSNRNVIGFNQYSCFDEYRLKKHIRFYQYYFIIEENSENSSIISLPFCRKETGDLYYDFMKWPLNLKEIHLIYPQPEDFYRLIKGNEVSWKCGITRINIPMYIRENIVLYVPYGCKKYFQDHPDYQGYKAIMEDSLWKRFYDIFCILFIEIYTYYQTNLLYFLITIIGVIILCWIVYF